MSETRSFERLRHGALAMLADGNSIDAVSHVLEVPVDVVLAWRANPQEAPAAGASASAFAETAPPVDETPPALARDPTARVRFNTELAYAASGAFRMVALGGGVVLVVLALYIVIAAVRGHAGVDGLAEAALFMLVTAWAARTGLGWARRVLVLGTDSVSMPRLFRTEAIAYADIAGYDLEPRTIWFDQASIRGRDLSIRSRRPGVEPLTVFIFDAYPIARAMLDRLDEVVRANRGAPALPPLVSAAPRSPATRRLGPMAMYGLVLLLGMLELWPIFGDSLHTLVHGTPPLAALRHVEGNVAAANKCWTRSVRNGGDKVISIDVAQASGKEALVVPCLVDQDALIHHGWRRIAVDLDPEARPVPVVYQMSLDGHVLLAYDEARARQRHLDVVPALLGVLMPLGVFGLGLLVIRVTWQRSREAASGA